MARAGQRSIKHWRGVSRLYASRPWARYFRAYADEKMAAGMARSCRPRHKCGRYLHAAVVDASICKRRRRASHGADTACQLHTLCTIAGRPTDECRVITIALSADIAVIKI